MGRKGNRTILEAIRRDRGKPVKPMRSLIVLAMLMMVWVFIRYEPVTNPDDADVVVYVSSSCACYRPWIRELRRDGLSVSVVQTQDIITAQAQLGVPREFAACHTATAKNYWIEGHVPAESITTLLSDAPEDVAGLAHLRVEVGSGDASAWEVVTYDVDRSR